MIEIRNLTKIFTSKHHEITKALDDLSFDLPDNGFVFIIGKSGSGKTTLLNMIAGVDSFNTGEITVDGIKLSKLKGTKLDYYRNEMIGFIFQDYQLIDELTVFENIKLALEFNASNDYEKVYEVLKKVDLIGFEKRYPRELSGGEKQRVAIARALIKNPKIILADEPTGNLDTANTKQILKILENIAKEKLVLIVSHNIFDAHQFATYLLELQNGKIINSYKRNESINRSIEYKNNILRLPLHKDLDLRDEELLVNSLNSNIENVIQDDLDFVPYDFKFEKNNSNLELKKKHISIKNALKHGFSFIKRSFVSILSFSLIIGTLFGVVNASEAINNIDINRDTQENIKIYDRELVPLIGVKNKPVAYKVIKDEHLNRLKNGGYKGKIYEGYYTSSNNVLDPNTTPFSSHMDNLLIVDNDYFKKYKYNFDLVAEASKYEKFGIYITDYSLDIRAAFDKRYIGNYDSYLEYRNPYHEYVNGVINTHYKEKYPQLFEIIKSYEPPEPFSNLIKDVPRKILEDFYYDCGIYYSNCFTFEENFFEEHFKANNKVVNHLERYISLNYNDKKFNPNVNRHSNIEISSSRPSYLTYESYKALTHKEIDFNGCGKYKEIEPIKITLESKIVEHEDENDLYTKPIDLEFTRVTNPKYQGNFDIGLNSFEYYDEIISLIPRTIIVLENNSNLKQLVNNGSIDESLVLNNFSFVLYKNVGKLTSVFEKLFLLIISILLIAIIVSLVFYSLNLVKSNIKNIGIFKSLGARSIDILLSLSINLIVSIILTIFLYFGLSYAITSISEIILINSIKNGSIECINLYNAHLLFMDYRFHIVNILGIIVLSVVSFITLFIKLNKLKPTELIKSTNR